MKTKLKKTLEFKKGTVVELNNNAMDVINGGSLDKTANSKVGFSSTLSFTTSRTCTTVSM